MQHRAYAVCQAVAKENPGIKTTLSPWGHQLALFIDKESAREYLRKVLEQIKHEQSIGARTTWNLDKDRSLDFCIVEATIDVPDDVLRGRGWDLSTGVR